MDSDDHICPACGKYFQTIKGVNSHLSTARKCEWYRKGKRREMFEDAPEVILDGEAWVEGQGYMEVDEEGHEIYAEGQGQGGSVGQDNAMDRDIEYDIRTLLEYEEVYELIEIPNPVAVGEPGPGPSTAAKSSTGISSRSTSISIDNMTDTDERIVIEHSTAGKVIRMGKNLHDKWRLSFGKDKEGDAIMEGSSSQADGGNPFAPFSSELDWRVAAWAVKDGIGHKSFDRLLAIPGASPIRISTKLPTNISLGQGEPGSHIRQYTWPPPNCGRTAPTCQAVA